MENVEKKRHYVRVIEDSSDKNFEICVNLLLDEGYKLRASAIDQKGYKAILYK